MSRLKELIDELCPDGVEFKTLGDLCVSLKKGTLKQTSLVENGKYPVINSGRELYGYYSSFNNDCEAITIASRGEYAGFISYISGKFWAGGLCYPYAVKDKEVCNTRFLYHMLKRKEQEIMNTMVARGSIPALNKSDIDKLAIPVPPREVQREIVRILDNFSEKSTELCELLSAEMIARKKQYEYYREKLLTFGDDVPRVPLGEIANIIVGGDVPKDRFSKEKTAQLNVPIFSNGVGESALYGFTDKPRISVPSVTISARGTIGYCSLRKEPFFPIVRLICAIPHEEVHVDYLKYFLDTVKFIVPKTGIPQLTAPEVAKTKIPLLPLPEQKRIADILDRFDSLCNDLTSGIPAEIAARKKQYEYYRDKLLSFKELGA